jgi:hypothetical protein
LHALLLDLLLLLLNLSLGLLIRSLLVLHRVANRVTGYSAQSAADRGARTRMTDRSANNRASASPKARTTQSAFFPCGKWLPGTSCGENCRCQSGHDRESDTHERPPHCYDTMKTRHGFTDSVWLDCSSR